jgi:dTDP-4-amino-4,6-dideoxygalactose transaminase
MAIQVLTPTFDIEGCLKEIRQCLEKGWTGVGYKTVEFEKKWKEYTGLSNAHFLNSATSGLHLAVKLFKEFEGWEDGDEIITTPITFVSTNHVILYENLKPVFADVDDYLCLDPYDAEKKITNKTRAIMFVGYSGNVGQYDKIVELCKKYNLKLILDAAHMAGTRYNGEIPGKEADAIIYSFQAVKPMPTFDSGMVCFKDSQYDSLARKFSWMGIDKDTFARTNAGIYKWKYDVPFLGYKYNGNSIAAAIAIAQLKQLDKDNQKRREVADIYNNFFKECHNITVIPTTPGCLSSQHLYVIAINNRDKILNKLSTIGINCSVHYICNTEFPMYSYAKGTCPNAEKMSNRIMTLPIHLRLTNEQIKGISNNIRILTRSI